MTRSCHARPQSCNTRALSAAELPAAALLTAARRGARGAARTLVLVAEDQPALFEVVGRHLDGDAVAGQRLDAVLLHLAGGVGDDLVACIELHAVARVGEDFGDQSFELDQLFLSHGSLQIGGTACWVAGCGWVGASVGFRDAKTLCLAVLLPCRRLGANGPETNGAARDG